MVVDRRSIDIKIVELLLMLGEFSILAFELLRDILQIMEVAALITGAIFHKRVVQFIPQSVSLG